MYAVRDDYQQFTLHDGRVIAPGQRMRDKLEAIPLPDVEGLDVLDIGCDMGFWSFLCADRGARVIGLDRGRPVKGEPTDLIEMNNAVGNPNCTFYPINVGEQWRTYGRFDVVLLFSLYHHIYAQVEDHAPIWFWLWLQTKGDLIWENPISSLDRVVQINVPAHLQAGYNQESILAAASQYFDAELIGPARHEPHRLVYRFTPKPAEIVSLPCQRVSGAGGASKAWRHNDNARTHEFMHITGHQAIPGSINLKLSEPFDWDRGYLRARMSDAIDRKKGVECEWKDRWVRLYPCFANRKQAFIFRFEGENYPSDFVEIVSSHRIDGDIDLKVFQNGN
jgi:SAM-dependent methyltransferase